MSDPVTNLDVEDVLSSIRRLVSETDKPDPAAGDAADTSAADADRLVLTPALRVAEKADAQSHAQPDMGTEEQAVAPEQDPVSGTSPEAALDGTGAAPQDGREAVLDVLARELTGAGAQAPEEEEETPALMFSHRPNRSRDSQEAAVPEPDAARAAEEEALEAAVRAVEQASSDPGTPDGAADANHAERPENAPDVAMDMPAPETPGAAASDIESRISEWEAVVARHDAPYEPAAPGEGDYAGTEVEAMAWEDVETEQDAGAPAPEAAPASARDGTRPVEPVAEPGPDPIDAVAADLERNVADLGPDEAFLDESMLRDLVGEIVREELQGALGERITRNVRKLVRREIHRALAAQKLSE